ncbi:MAG: hypothetical protein ACH34V_09115 [Flavobacterium sp.]|uniref:hypothetical protein n=1 Tax=Flavobacterium sp. TaxID=239 RepID=UPI0037A53389
MLQRKSIKRKVVKRKNSTKKVSNKVKKRNPNIKVHNYQDKDSFYIKLEDFQDLFIKELKVNLSKEDFSFYAEYYDMKYETDNILKYGLRNSNAVGSGIFHPITITKFKKIMADGLAHRFIDSNYFEILLSFEKTISDIPKKVEYIDLGN